MYCRVADVARAAFTERSGSSTKGRTPNIRYSVAKLTIVAIYTLFERLSQGFERKSSCFRRAFNKSHLAFIELSTKVILLSQSFQQKPKTTNIKEIVKKTMFLSRKFANTRSTKALRDYFALAESPLTPATLYVCTCMHVWFVCIYVYIVCTCI